MQLDELKKAWEQEMNVEQKAIDFDRIRRQADAFDRRAKSAWAIELFACAAVIIACVIGWVTLGKQHTLHPLFHLGMFAMIVSCGYVAWKIIFARKVATADNWTLLARLNIQIEKREKEMKLLSSVAQWYLTPLFIAILLASYGGYVQRTGSYVPDLGAYLYWAASFGFYVAIYFYNKYSAKTRVQPVLDKLYALRAELVSD